ncbi:disulfide bond formation protein B [Candidatus Bartonella washoeensis]|uniref:disulfide bond formation protein B n=1 Tax=Candidatus Bartonella washoeensis TaxID=186739 RepID=UPI000DE598BF|nr:disulfide bond formation protein B [Bartonella washoeensis]
MKIHHPVSPVLPVSPCPLCLLQRLGFIVAGCGFLFNILHRVKNIHYGMVIFGCTVTCISAAKQILLQMILGNLADGPTLFGLRLYSWAFIVSVLYIFVVAFIMILSEVSHKFKICSPFSVLSKMASFLFVFLIAANLLTVILECGDGLCASDSVRYGVLSNWFHSSS